MICKNCGMENPDRYVFCQNCLADLPNPDFEKPANNESDEKKINKLFSSKNKESESVKSQDNQQNETSSIESEKAPQAKSVPTENITKPVNNPVDFKKAERPVKKIRELDTSNISDVLKENPSKANSSNNIFSNPEEPYLHEPSYDSSNAELPKIVQKQYKPASNLKKTPSLQDINSFSDFTDDQSDVDNIIDDSTSNNFLDENNFNFGANFEEDIVINIPDESDVNDFIEIEPESQEAFFSGFSKPAPKSKQNLTVEPTKPIDPIKSTDTIESTEPVKSIEDEHSFKLKEKKNGFKAMFSNKDNKDKEKKPAESKKKKKPAKKEPKIVQEQLPSIDEDDFSSIDFKDEERMDFVLPEVEVSEPYKKYETIKQFEDASMEETPLTKKELQKQEKQINRDLKHKKKLEKQMSRGRSSYEYYDYFDYYDEAALKKERTRSTIINTLFWIVLVGLIFITGFFLSRLAIDRFGSLPRAMKSIFNIGSDNIETEPYEMVYSVENDIDCHILTVYAEEGDTITFNNIVHPPIKRDVAGQVPIAVPDKYFLPEEPSLDQDTIIVEPSVIITNKRGVSRELDIKPFNVAVPSVYLTLDSPANTNNIVLENDALTISGNVSNPDEVSLFLGDTDITSSVQPDGTFNYAYTPEQDGNFSLELIAKAKRHRSAIIKLTGSSSKPAIAITVEDYVGVTDSDKTAIKGKVEPDSTLKVIGLIGDDWTFDKTTGAFSFTALLDTLGINEYTIIAEKDNGATTSEKVLKIVRTPSLDAYSQQAQSFDYKNAVADISNNINKTFTFNATVNNIKDEGNYYSATLFVGGAEDQKIQINYFGKDGIINGESYKILGDVKGISQDQTMLIMDVFFMLNQTDQA